jgi:hypothetical protein
MIVPGGSDSWVRLNAALTITVHGLMVADFDGDGLDDIGLPSGTPDNFELKISRSGRSDWSVAVSGVPISAFTIAGAGRFDDAKGADLFFWNVQDKEIYVSSSGTQKPQLFSRQVMR